MTLNEKDIVISLETLKEKVNELTAFYQRDINHQQMVYTHWNVKDVLGHLTFWHESFARNINDLAHAKKPNTLRGKLSEVNEQSVSSTQHNSIKELINRLEQAQTTIENHIFNQSIKLIPYKMGSRPYSRKEHLDIVSNHIKRHLKDLNQKINQNGKT